MLYQSDLAYIHDARFGEVARSAAPVLLEALARAGVEDGLVVDLGCGSGIFSEPLAAAGYQVLGIDASAPMPRLARRRVPDGTFRRGSLHDVEIPRAVAVAGIGECFNYFVERPVSERGLARLFRRILRALLPGGVLLFDMAAPGRVLGPGAAKSHFEARDWAILVTTEEDRSETFSRGASPRFGKRARAIGKARRSTTRGSSRAVWCCGLFARQAFGRGRCRATETFGSREGSSATSPRRRLRAADDPGARPARLRRSARGRVVRDLSPRRLALPPGWEEGPRAPESRSGSTP